MRNNFIEGIGSWVELHSYTMAKEVRVFYSLFLNILFFLTFFCHTWFPFFMEKRKRHQREKNREALSLVIITYRDILFLYDGFTLIPSLFFLFTFP